MTTPVSDPSCDCFFEVRNAGQHAKSAVSVRSWYAITFQKINLTKLQCLLTNIPVPSPSAREQFSKYSVIFNPEIGIGEDSRPSPSPHHRAYGSVHSGSCNFT